MDFVHNNPIEKVVLNSYEQALKIPDAFVKYHFIETPGMAVVQSMSNSSHLHIVYNADCRWACCTCAWAELGNICKHQIKVLLMNGISHDHMLQRCVDLYAGRVVESHAIAPSHVHIQNEELDTFLHDDVEGDISIHQSAAYNKASITPSSCPKLPRERIACLESLCGNLLSLVGEDTILVDEACAQMKKTLELISSLKSRSDYGANNAFLPVDDGFGNTLKRAKPIIERVFSKRRFKGEESATNPFIAQPKEKRLSMQAKLNEKAKAKGHE